MTEPNPTEVLCLEEVELALSNRDDLATKLAQRVRHVYLEHEYPETQIVVTGERTYDGSSWCVRFPIWKNTGGTHDGVPMPRFIGTLVYAEVLEA